MEPQVFCSDLQAILIKSYTRLMIALTSLQYSTLNQARLNKRNIGTTIKKEINLALSITLGKMVQVLRTIGIQDLKLLMMVQRKL